MILISFWPKFNSSSNEPRHEVASIVISVNRDLNYDSNGFKIMKTGTFDEIKSEQPFSQDRILYHPIETVTDMKGRFFMRTVPFKRSFINYRQPYFFPISFWLLMEKWKFLYIHNLFKVQIFVKMRYTNLRSSFALEFRVLVTSEKLVDILASIPRHIGKSISSTFWSTFLDILAFRPIWWFLDILEAF